MATDTKDETVPDPKPIYPGVELNKETQIALTVIAYIDAFYWEGIYRKPMAVDEQEQALKALGVDVEAIRQLAKIVSRM